MNDYRDEKIDELRAEIKAYRKTVAGLVAAQGGEIRLDRRDLDSIADGDELSYVEDKVNRCMVYQLRRKDGPKAAKPDFGQNRESMPGAFPFVSHGSAVAHQYVDPGMTLRDYFAAAALPALIKELDWSRYAHSVAEEAYRLADEMLHERAKTK